MRLAAGHMRGGAWCGAGLEGVCGNHVDIGCRSILSTFCFTFSVRQKIIIALCIKIFVLHSISLLPSHPPSLSNRQCPGGGTQIWRTFSWSLVNSYSSIVWSDFVQVQEAET